MSAYLIWILLGFLLLIIELTTGTFYLLVLGSAAFAGALSAWLGAPFWVQAAVGGGVALAGVVVVWKLRARDVEPVSSNVLDVGQAVVLESWVDRGSGRARVRYRNALWDATVRGEPTGEPGAVFYIHNVSGSELEVASARAG
ncbi:MAG: NfeD family protein [Pseudomonadota bacterium]|jgi:membrane protein implicated in regulation of membrane protease activity